MSDVVSVDDGYELQRMVAANGCVSWVLKDPLIHPEALLMAMRYVRGKRGKTLLYRDVVFDLGAAEQSDAWSEVYGPGSTSRVSPSMCFCARDLQRTTRHDWVLVDPVFPFSKLVAAMKLVDVEEDATLQYRGFIISIIGTLSALGVLCAMRVRVFKEPYGSASYLARLHTMGGLYAALVMQLGPAYRKSWDHIRECDLSVDGGPCFAQSLVDRCFFERGFYRAIADCQGDSRDIVREFDRAMMEMGGSR